MSKNLKVQILTFILWAINVKVFLLVSNWQQITLIFKYSKGIVDFYVTGAKYYYDFVTTIPSGTLALTIIFAVLLYIFWLYYFKVYFYKLPQAQGAKDEYIGIIATIITFLGFGCVACGQTLLTSIVFLFVSGSSSLLSEFVGNFSMVIGIALLSYGAYRNYKMYHDKNICKLDI